MSFLSTFNSVHLIADNRSDKKMIDGKTSQVIQINYLCADF
jgi:hypothetical protein